jgi:hypothetical protein
MQASKILFSEEELRRAENSEWILTKNRIIKKIIALFASLAGHYQEVMEAYRHPLPAEVYLQSPNLPRRAIPGTALCNAGLSKIFSKENVLAIRTFFWWGNYFSSPHLKGIYKDKYQEKILQSHDLLAKHNFSVAISEDEWRHDFESGNYSSLDPGAMDLLERNIYEKDFLKLAVSWNLTNANEIDILLQEQFTILMDVVTG